jgi:hypothetical protein
MITVIAFTKYRTIRSFRGASWLLALLLLAQLFLVRTSSAIIWKSSFFHCQVDLPEGEPQINPWLPLSSVDPTADETGITGARRVDRSAVVFLGVVHLKDKPGFTLNQNTVQQLTKPFFGTSIGFQHDVKPISHNGLNGLRLTGTHRFLGYNYNLVVDMFQWGDVVYQVAGLAENGDPMKDGDIRSFMQSFRITQ